MRLSRDRPPGLARARLFFWDLSPILPWPIPDPSTRGIPPGPALFSRQNPGQANPRETLLEQESSSSSSGEGSGGQRPLGEMARFHLYRPPTGQIPKSFPRVHTRVWARENPCKNQGYARVFQGVRSPVGRGLVRSSDRASHKRVYDRFAPVDRYFYDASLATFHALEVTLWRKRGLPLR